ncbi:sensor histidine kinase [Draconibacterium halophilum]|uniref:histidine kinase n=1 Tax=Draconibacterium halophilum TaxID=2706887 RepID=A0A6C0RFX4_9BACT|nr:PAS domain-containing sensor histidine kinase [Draconibacterium halophilum]QIA08565.1 PAS domain-containing sensor histidine kinase [Draconibacterium halophilum]
MLKRINKILAERFWAAKTDNEKKQLFQLLLFWGVVGVLSLILSLIDIITSAIQSDLVGYILLLSITILAIVCTFNARKNCAINVIFSLPVFIYAFYISDLTQHAPLIETVHLTVWWLMAGLVFLYYFSMMEIRIVSYFFVSLALICFQLFKAGHLSDAFSYFDPFVSNPILIFTAFFLVTFYLRKKLITNIEVLAEEIDSKNEAINRVLQNSSFLISRLRAVRDEDGNITNLVVEKINNAFESAFKRNLYELQEQEADYVFNLIFKGTFDVNKTVLFTKKRVTEFHAKNLDKWFKIRVINAMYNSYYLVFEDITKSKKQLADLEASKRRYKVLLEAIPDIFFVIDKDGIYEDFVIKESDLFKIEDSNIIGSSIFNAGFPDKMANKIYSCIQHCIKNDSIESIEYSLNTPNGTFMFEMRLAKLNANTVISVARDISKRKTAEFGLEKALVKAEESDRLKSAFLANLSHEIRTPMNIISNFTRMLADDSLDGLERLQLTEAITQNGQQLLNMIDNTVHLAKIETENIPVNTTFSKINPLLRDIYNAYFAELPDSKDIRISLNTDVATPEFGFSTDPGLLKEIMKILVDNAVKFTLTGQVTFGFEMIRNDFIKFYVADTGVGIPKEDHEHIFSRFYRVQNSINQSTSGSGIGLPIAQHYVTLLGGELEFESKVDKGSNFWFTLPFNEGSGYMKIVG